LYRDQDSPYIFLKKLAFASFEDDYELGYGLRVGIMDKPIKGVTGFPVSSGYTGLIVIAII